MWTIMAIIFGIVSCSTISTIIVKIRKKFPGSILSKTRKHSLEESEDAVNDVSTLSKEEKQKNVSNTKKEHGLCKGCGYKNESSAKCCIYCGRHL